VKKQTKQNIKGAKERQEDPQIMNGASSRENMQPVPQPKDYEEIEY
jgi:hypothetical protein